MSPPLVLEAPGDARRRRWGGALSARLGFAGPVVVALVLNFWRLSGNGLGNTYYAAAVRSMTQSWRNFFFGAFDPGGFITVDKPPLALWFQAASAKIFGFSSWSLLLPGALAGAGAVALLWAIVHRRFGPAAATVAAAVLALSPINVAVDRLNLPDPFMIFFLLAAAWALLRSFDSPHWARWLALAGLLFGAAFDAKMLAAAIPAPAFGLAVLLGSPGGVAHRLKRATVLAAAALAFALPWMATVDLTPASARPYVGGSANNTERNLIIGYNGLGRVDGQGEGHGGAHQGGPRTSPSTTGTATTPAGPGGPGGGGNRGRFDGFGGFSAAAPGPLRLFDASVGPQIAWLLPAGLLAALAALWHHRRSRPALATVALWTGWVALHAAVFSFAQGIFHSYYTSALAPGLAALIGIGAAAVLAETRRHRAWLGVVAVAVTASAWLAVDMSDHGGSFYAWTRPAVVVLAAVTVSGLLIVALARRPRLTTVPLAVGLGAMLLTPAAWALSVTANPSRNAEAQAGPQRTSRGRFGAEAVDADAGPQAGARGAAGGRFGGDVVDEAGLARFLAAHTGGERWSLATTNAMSAADLVARYDVSVMALGGFRGSDPAATVSTVAAMVDKGEIRYFLADGGGRGGFGRRFGRDGDRPGNGAPFGAPSDSGTPPPGPGGVRGGTAGQVMSAVQATCSPVSSAATDGQAALPSTYDGQVYDCAGRGRALAAHG